MKEKKQVKATFKPFLLKPKTKNQKILLHSLQQSDIPLVIAEGYAGTGKTLTAVNWAAHEVENGNKYKNIVLIRPPEPLAGRTVGYLKGSANDKMMVWCSQLTSYIKQAIGNEKYEELCLSENIQIQLLESIRGMSYSNSIVIVDESQLLTPKEIQAIVTRIGSDSKLIFCGDTLQTDIKKNTIDGLSYLKRIVEKYDIPCEVIKFTIDDCLRSDLCKKFLDAFEKEGWDNYGSCNAKF